MDTNPCRSPAPTTGKIVTARDDAETCRIASQLTCNHQGVVQYSVNYRGGLGWTGQISSGTVLRLADIMTT